jgi:hypothetical protein
VPELLLETGTDRTGEVVARDSGALRNGSDLRRVRVAKTVGQSVECRDRLANGDSENRRSFATRCAFHGAYCALAIFAGAPSPA